MKSSIGILYASKHQTTEKLAIRLAERLSKKFDISIENVKKEKNIPLDSFDALVLGTSIYAGRPVFDFKKIITGSDTHLSKPIFLFICGMEPDVSKQEIEIKTAFPDYIYDKAKGKYFLGGEFDFKKMNFIERMVIKKIAKTDKDISNIKEENFNQLISDIQQYVK